MMSMRHWFILAAIGTAFGASFTCNGVLLATFGPLTVSAFRVGIGAIGCWFWVFASRRPVSLSLSTLPSLGVFGIFQFAAPFAIFPLVQEHIASSTAGIANALTPVVTVLVSNFWAGGERASVAKLGGAAFGLLGVTVLASQGQELTSSHTAFVFLALCAPICYAIALNFVRRFHGFDPLVLLATAMTGGALAIAPAAIVLEGAPPLPNAGALLVLLFLGVALTTATFAAMYSILPTVGPTNLSLVTFIAPISATILGCVVLDEAISFGTIGGLTLILVGLAVIDGRLFQFGFKLVLLHVRSVAHLKAKIDEPNKPDVQSSGIQYPR